LIAKVISSGNSSNSMAFARMVNYITNRDHESMEQIASGEAHKVEWVEITNCLNDENIDLVIAEVRAIQDMNQRAKHKSYHFVLSFPEGERPSDAVVRDAEERVIFIIL